MSHRSFTLVLAGGGARGYAHVGVLRELEHMGLTPAGIVGVSMGAVVAATYAARRDWYEALMHAELPETVGPGTGHGSHASQGPAVSRAWSRARTAWNLVTGWGGPDEAYELARATLDGLLGESRLDEGRVPVVVCGSAVGGPRGDVERAGRSRRIREHGARGHPSSGRYGRQAAGRRRLHGHRARRHRAPDGALGRRRGRSEPARGSGTNQVCRP